MYHNNRYVAPWPQEKRDAFVTAWASGTDPEEMCAMFDLSSPIIVRNTARRLNISELGREARAVLSREKHLAWQRRCAEERERNARRSQAYWEQYIAPIKAKRAAERSARSLQREIAIAWSRAERAVLREQRETQIKAERTARRVAQQEKTRLREQRETQIKAECAAKKAAKQSLLIYTQTLKRNTRTWTDREITMFRELVSQGTSLQECGTLLKKKPKDLESLSKRLGLRGMTDSSIGVLRRD